MNNSFLKRGTMVTLAIMLGLSVAACGKKGPLEPPTDAGQEYPRDYPTQ
ncbi:lipoprotein [Thalassospira sp.]|nr:lipoprotein [Thalassospira sp.]|tara:strand:- start:4433 stop:4579 length:147 start_codon:yes stop_codon:yes gene_type:complete